MNFQGQVVVITGGSSGIGKATALEFAKRGADVAIIARTPHTVAIAVDEIKHQTDREIVGMVADVGDMGAVRSAFDAILDRLGRVDILVNCAGINIRKTLLETTEEEWDEVIRVNLKGVFVCCRVVAEIMIKQNSGAIVNVSSMGAKQGSTSPHYSASKAGIHGLSACLAKELAPYGIRVNVVAPGPIETRMAKQWSSEKRESLQRATLLGRIGMPAEVAKAIVFLASEDASYITGEILDVNGGILID